MSEIILPRPDNVRGRFGQFVTSDVFDIARRLWELGKTVNVELFVSVLDPPVTKFGRTYKFVISEFHRETGDEHFVMYLKELDGRAVTACERMLKIPFKQRVRESERLNEKWEAEQKEATLDKLYDDMGGPMRIQLERCGFTDPWGPKYAPMNRTARRARQYGKANGVPGRA